MYLLCLPDQYISKNCEVTNQKIKQVKMFNFKDFKQVWYSNISIHEFNFDREDLILD